MDKDFYTIKEFAANLRVSPITIRRAIKNGRINAFRAGGTEKSSFRIPASEIHRMGIVDLKKIVQTLVQEEKNVDRKT